VHRRRDEVNPQARSTTWRHGLVERRRRSDDDAPSQICGAPPSRLERGLDGRARAPFHRSVAAHASGADVAGLGRRRFPRRSNSDSGRSRAICPLIAEAGFDGRTRDGRLPVARRPMARRALGRLAPGHGAARDTRARGSVARRPFRPTRGRYAVGGSGRISFTRSATTSGFGALFDCSARRMRRSP